MLGRTSYLVSNCHTGVGVKEAVGIATVDPVDDVILLFPIAAKSSYTFGVLLITLNEVNSRQAYSEGGSCLTFTNCRFRKSGAVLAIEARLSA